jgi:hypothetical protein
MAENSPAPLGKRSRWRDWIAYLRCMAAVAIGGKHLVMQQHERERSPMTSSDSTVATAPDPARSIAWHSASEHFASELLGRTLALPSVVPCSSEQLYRMFVHWCGSVGLASPPARSVFTRQVKRYMQARAGRGEDHLHYKVVRSARSGTVRCWCPSAGAPAPGEAEGAWVARSIVEFERAADASPSSGTLQ